MARSEQAIEEKWSRVMTPEGQLLNFNLKELWNYRDLILLFVRRDFIAVYKQTILGPAWHLVQPLFTTLVYYFFSGMIGIGTDGLPRMLFVLSGVVIWNYFSSCLTKTASTFVNNSHIFGKVYFPRLVIPVSVIISNLMSFCIQFLLLIPFLVYYRHSIHPTIYIIGIPILVIIIAMMGLGFGVIVSSLTIKYRDLIYLITFGVQLAMYMTPVIYPLSIFAKKFPAQLLWLASLNPLSPIIEAFRFALLGQGTFTYGTFMYSVCCAFVVLIVGVLMFNRVEKDFMDVV